MSARAWALFAAVATLWGVPYLFIKVAVDDGVPPIFLAWARLVLGAAVLLGLAWRAGSLGDVRGRVGWLAAYALIEVALPFPLIGYGEQRVSSSLTAILIATVPMIVALLALRFDAGERVGGSRLAGLLVGFGGVVALVGVDVAGSGRELVGVGAILLSSVGYAAGPMLYRRKAQGIDTRAAMGVTLALGALMLTPAALLDPPDATPGADTLAAVAALGVLSTAAAFLFFGLLLMEVGAGRALVITYVAPVVAVTLGMIVLSERPGAGAFIGLVLILGGSWLSTGGRSRGVDEPVTEERVAAGRA